MMADYFCDNEKILTEEEQQRLDYQNSKLVSEYKAQMLEKEAQRHWDLFYKRNEDRFFKDRHWTTREFEELLGESDNKERKCLLEVGCGVGNLIFPLVEEKRNFFVHACDFSPRAVGLVQSNELYDANFMHAFECDITTNQIYENIERNSVDIVTLIFVLSAIHPQKFQTVVNNICEILKPNGIILFRDYGLHDMAQLRFKPGHKISENFYMRQDGTRSYYFSTRELEKIFMENGFNVITNNYVQRRTINKKEKIDVPRIFVQAKFQKNL